MRKSLVFWADDQGAQIKQDFLSPPVVTGIDPLGTLSNGHGAILKENTMKSDFSETIVIAARRVDELEATGNLDGLKTLHSAVVQFASTAVETKTEAKVCLRIVESAMMRVIAKKAM